MYGKSQKHSNPVKSDLNFMSPDKSVVLVFVSNNSCLFISFIGTQLKCYANEMSGLTSVLLKYMINEIRLG